MKFFSKYSVKKGGKERSVSEMLPYLHHYTDDILITKSKDIMCTVEVSGFSFETADDEMLDVKKHAINNILKGISDEKFTIYVHTIRTRGSGFPGGNFSQTYTRILNEAWRKKFDSKNTFANKHYVTVVRRSQSGAISFISDMLSRITGQREEDERREIKEAVMSLNEVKDRIVNGLAAFKTKLLGVRYEDGEKYSEIIEFLSFIMNLGFPQKVLFSRLPISKYINTQRLYFGDNVIESLGTGWRKYAGIVSLKEYRPTSYAGVVDNFLKLPYEFVMTQSFSFTNKGSAITKMQLQQRRLAQSGDVAVSQVADINQALDEAMSGFFAFGDHHLTIMPITDSLRELDNALSQCVVEFANIGGIGCRERINMGPCYWGQFPGNISYIARKSTINTLNFAGYASLHNYPSGKINKNHWGDAVTSFNTTSGTTYFFSFHARDVGHTMIIGPTGAGKTVLLNFLAAQTQKFNPRTFFFDKDRGAEIFIRAIGGKYTNINPGESCNINPLLLKDTQTNRNFLFEWLQSLVTTNGEKLMPKDLEKIQMAIDGNYRLPVHQRRLANIAPFCGLEGDEGIASRLKPWYGSGAKSRLFDNEIDLIDFSTGSVFGFDMNEILKDKMALGPVLMYLFHKINLSLDGTPTMIILDEAWALIDNPVFAPKIKDWLKVLRKLNAFVVFATQSVEDAAKSQISDTLVQQCATQIFLPNLRATECYIDVFMLSMREYDIVKTTDPSTRFFLLKQDSDAVVAKLDLKNMDDYINVLSGRTETVLLLDSIRKEYGDDPDSWLYIFLEKSRKV